MEFIICPLCKQELRVSFDEFNSNNAVYTECIHGLSYYEFISWDDESIECLIIDGLMIKHSVCGNSIKTYISLAVDRYNHEKYHYIDGYLFDFRDENISQKIRKLIVLL